jgi:hypothetical protein
LVFSPQAVDERDGMIMHLRVDPAFDPLRSYPRFQTLLRHMNLSPQETGLCSPCGG